MKGVKSGSIEFSKRINMVQNWILQDIPKDMMIRQIFQLGWCTTDRQARDYIYKGRDRWVRHMDQDTDELVKLKVVELQERKRTMKEEYRGTPAGIRSLNEIDKMIIDLLGLNKPIQVKIKAEITYESVKEYTTDQLITMMSEN